MASIWRRAKWDPPTEVPPMDNNGRAGTRRPCQLWLWPSETVGTGGVNAPAGSTAMRGDEEILERDFTLAVHLERTLGTRLGPG